MTVKDARLMLAAAIVYLKVLAEDKRQRRILTMHMDHRYEEKQQNLAVYLGYDQWAAWLVIVEWFWMVALAIIGIMPDCDAKLLTTERLLYVLKCVTTTKQDRLEYGDKKKKVKGIGHDILALLELMRKYLPKGLWRWLHYTATSYDTISTAYALQLRVVFKMVLWPKLMEIDESWRQKIQTYSHSSQMLTSHLQPALPGTIGFYLACQHRQFTDCARELKRAALSMPVKFCGMTGTASSQRAVGISKAAEKTLAQIFDMPKAKGSTQIAPAHHAVRFYNEVVATAGPIMSVADDLRMLHMPQLGEIIPSPETTSTSSAGAAKEANPIICEQVCGMDVLVWTTALRLWATRASNFQRDLRWSSVMRTYVEAIEYFCQQITSFNRQMKVLTFDERRCLHWVEKFGPASMAELLHNAMQRQGFAGAHSFVKKELVSRVKTGAANLAVAAEEYMKSEGADPKFARVWKGLTRRELYLLKHPVEYVGDSVVDAKQELRNRLEPLAA
jgi:adenylosuccinate lyase